MNLILQDIMLKRAAAKVSLDARFMDFEAALLIGDAAMVNTAAAAVDTAVQEYTQLTHLFVATFKQQNGFQ